LFHESQSKGIPMPRDTFSSSCPVELLPDGPVPGLAQSGICGGPHGRPHEVERTVQRALLSAPDIQFGSLQVHRTENGICLTGTMSVAEGDGSQVIERIVQRASGVLTVLNRLVVQQEEIAASSLPDQ